MKLLAGLVALAVATQALRLDTNNATPMGYRAGNVYKYNYKGLSMSGIPLVSNDRTGIALWTNVELIFQTTENVLLRLETPEVRQIRFESTEDLIQPSHVPDLTEETGKFIELPTDIKTDLINYLLKPVTFTLSSTRGLVSDIMATEDEPEWCLNIKRAIISQFQLQFVSKVEHLTEDTMIGEQCLVHYDMIKPTEETTENVRFITKEVVPEKCRTTAIFRDVIGFQGYRFEETDETLKSHFISKYEIAESNRQFFIKSCVTEGRITARPLSPENGELVTFTRQELRFTESEPIKSVKINERLVKRGDTVFSHLESTDNQMTDIYTDILPETTKVEMIKTLLMNIVETIESETHATIEVESMHEYMHLTKLVRSLTNKQSVTTLVDFAFNPAREQKMRNFFTTTLAVSGSPAVVQCLPELKTRLTTYELNTIITSLPLTHLPTSETIKTLRTLYENSHEMTTRRQILLVLGSEVFNLCRPSETFGQIVPASVCDTKLKMTMKQFFVTEFLRNDDEQRLFVLKAIGNSGLDMSDFLKQQIRTTTLSKDLRVNAIYALRRCENTDKIRETLVPVFRNEDNLFDAEMRIASFHVLIGRIPTPEMLNVLLARMNEETCRQVGNFVYTYITNLIELPTVFQPTRELTLAAQQHLSTLKRFEDGILFSMNMKYMLTSLSYRMANLIETNTIHVSEQGLPRSMNIRMIKAFFGYYIDFFEAGFRVQGADNVVKTILESIWEQYPEAMNMMMSDRFRREMTNLQSMLRDEIVPKQLEDSNMYFFLKTMGHELGVFTLRDLTETDMEENINYLTNWDSRVRYFNMISLTQATHKQQSPLGIPVTADIGSVIKLSFHSDLLTTETLVDRTFVPRILLRAVGRVGSDLGLLKSTIGHSLHLKIALPLKVTIDTTNEEYVFEINVDDKSLMRQPDFFEIAALPIHITERYDTETRTFTVEITDVKIHELMTPTTISDELFGVNIMIQTHSLAQKTIKLPSFPFCGRHLIRMSWVSEMKPFGLRTIVKEISEDLKMNVLFQLNPRIPSISQEVETRLSLLKDEKIFIELEVLPTSLSSVFRFFWTYDITSGDINPKMSWLDAAEERPIEIVTKVQWGWDRTFTPLTSDLLTKTIVTKSDLQKLFEIEDSLIEGSDCNLCEASKPTWQNVYCDRCLFKRSWLSRLDTKVFFNKEKLIDFEYLMPFLTTSTYPYLNYFSTEYFTQDVTKDLLTSERTFLNNLMKGLPTTNKLFAFHLIHDVHPYLSEHNITVDINYLHLVFEHLPLFTSERRIYNLPMNRLTDVATDRLYLTHFGTCTLGGNNEIETFDNVIFEMPEDITRPECEKLLIKDCTEEATFEVTTKDVTERKSLKIRHEDKLVEITPTGRNGFQVKVNNRPENFVNNKIDNGLVEIVHQQIRNMENTEDVKITVLLKTNMVSFTLMNDFVDVQLPLWFRNRVCGLCGDFTGEFTNEFKMPDQTVASSLQHFVMAYTEPECRRNM